MIDAWWRLCMLDGSTVHLTLHSCKVKTTLEYVTAVIKSLFIWLPAA